MDTYTIYIDPEIESSSAKNELQDLIREADGFSMSELDYFCLNEIDE